jgi:hypothetical protein
LRKLQDRPPQGTHLRDLCVESAAQATPRLSCVGRARADRVSEVI